MVDEQASLVEAARLDITVSDAELRQEIMAIPALQENGQFIGQQRYEQLLLTQAPPTTTTQFEASMRSGLVVEKMYATLTDWMATSDAELEREYRLRNEAVRLELIPLTADLFRDQVQLSDEEVERFFTDRQDEYRFGERRRIDYVLIDRDALRLSQEVSDEAVQRYYMDNAASYQTPERVRASHILVSTAGVDIDTARAEAQASLDRVRGGEDFSAVAREVSSDEGSAVNGGDLDYFTRGQMVAPFEDAAFTLEVGEISELVQSDFGFHIILVTDRQPAVTRTVDEVRGQIEDVLASQQTDVIAASFQRDFASRLAAGDTLEAAAALDFVVLQSGLFEISGAIPGIGVAPLAAASVFQLELGEVSDALSTTRGAVFGRLAAIEEPRLPELEELVGRVREDATRTRALELSQQRASAIAEALRGADDFQVAARQQGFEPSVTDLIVRDSALPVIGPSREVDRVAFELPVGAVSEPITTDDSTVILHILERDGVTDEEFQSARDAFREQLVNERRERFFSSYMTQAKQDMNIVVNEDVIGRIITAVGL